MKNSNEYLDYVREEILKVTGKVSTGITIGDIKKKVPADYQFIPYGAANDSEPLIKIKHTKAEFSEDEDWLISSASLRDHLKDGNEIKHRTLPFIAKIFGIETEEEYFINKLKAADIRFLFDECEEQTTGDSWRSCLYHVVRKLLSGTVKSVTINVTNLNFVHKIIPSLLHFIKGGGKIHLIYAPSSGYDLMDSKPFMTLWKLGVIITLLRFKDSIDPIEQGFIFDWLPADGELSEKLIFKLGKVDMVRINTNHFDRRPFYTVLEAQSDGKDIECAISAIVKKISKISLFKRTLHHHFEPMNDEDFLSFVRTVATTDPRIELYYGKTCHIKEVPIKDIYFRRDHFSTYKIYQHYRLMQLNEPIENPVLNPFNLFPGRNNFYPTIPPVLEHNPRYNRLEIAEGHHRILAAYLSGYQAIKTLVFDMDPTGVKPKKINGIIPIISNDLERLRKNISDESPFDPGHYPGRNLEGMLHQFTSRTYWNLGRNLLNEYFFRDAAELIKYSNGKYHVRKDNEESDEETILENDE